MHRILLKKSLAESRGLLVACLAALFTIFWTRVWLVSQFDMSRFRAILEQFREFERFAPVPFEQLFTYAGRIALSFDEPVVIVCVSVWAIARGSDCVSGELNRGTMEMLLAQPVSRLQVLWSQAAVTIGGAALLASASWLGIYAGILTNSVQETVPATWSIPWVGIELPNPLAEERTVWKPLAEEVDPAVFAPAAGNLFALGLFLAGVSAFCSSWDRYRWRTIGLVVGFCVVEMLVKLFSLAADRFRWLRYGTFFSAYDPQRAVSIAVNTPEQTWRVGHYDAAGAWVGLGPVGHDLVLIGLGVAAYLVAARVFQRRDLPAPL